MRFDDRLVTVLGFAPEGLHQRAVQWRQLVELVARGAARHRPDLRDQALDRIAALMRDVPEDVRAAAARAIAGPDVPAELVALFAANGIEAAAPLLTSAELDEAGWAAVNVVASPSVGAMIAALRPEQAPDTRPTSADVTPQMVDLPSPVSPRTGSSFGQYPQSRAELQRTPVPAGLFRWECNLSGEIDWVEGAPRAAMIGRTLPGDLQKRFAARLPFEDEHVRLTEQDAIAGEWQWSGAPAFLPGSGRFAGYRGTARRSGGAEAVVPVDAAVTLDDDALRELVHEVRTPLNAIIGFGDIIGGQYFGPTHLAYRERAGEIVNQARRLLEAVEDLDMAAKLRSGRSKGSDGQPFSSFFPALRLTLLEKAVARDVSLTISERNSGGPEMVPVQVAERLTRRFLLAVLAAATPGERLELVVDRLPRQIIVAIDRPEVIRGLTEEEVVEPGFALGFTLRLTRGLASIVGGSLDLAPERLVLVLPISKD